MILERVYNLAKPRLAGRTIHDVSTPLYPEAFTGTGVSVLSGTRWLSSEKEPILAGVSQCAGIKQLMKYGQKISVKVTRKEEI